MKKTNLTLTVNGQNHQLAPIPGETLADLLRKRLHLTGTKIGCNEAECGACTVIMDGEPVLSCSTPAERADGKTILTIEGLAQDPHPPRRFAPLPPFSRKMGGDGGGPPPPARSLHQARRGPVRVLHPRADYDFVCPAGEKPQPDFGGYPPRAQRHLCRCAGYPTIENAILAAAESLQTGQPVAEPQVPPSATEGQTVGTLKIRPDAVEKVTGSAIFTDDLIFENMLFASVKRAGVPHAFVRKIDVEQSPRGARRGGCADRRRRARREYSRPGDARLAGHGRHW
jgi:aerobic-type carbon monoxide dehydrogenase small subunit (CoxS/CutS family)